MKLMTWPLLLFLLTNFVLVSIIGAYFVLQSKSATNVSSGIFGKAVVGPTCPVEKPGEICSKPYEGKIVLKNQDKSREIARFSTDQNGGFRLKLAPGIYYLVGDQNSQFPILKETAVRVEANKFTEINIDLDTGIR